MATYLRDELNALYLNTDRLRKNFFGPSPSYDPQESEITYQIMMTHAEAALYKDRDVVLDATFNKPTGRVEAQAISDAFGAGFQLLKVWADEDTVRERLEDRENDASDAGYDIYRYMKDNWDDIEMEHEIIDNSGTIEETEDQLDSILSE